MRKQLILMLLGVAGIVLQSTAYAAYLSETVLTNDSFANAQFIGSASFTADYDVDINAAPGVNISETFVHASILGMGNNRLDFFSFNGIAGQAYFDIDYAMGAGRYFDASIALYNANQELLAFNDDSAPVESGSFSDLDSFLGYQLEDNQLYYLAVGQQCDLDDIALGADYTLHMSMSPSPVPVPAAVWLFASGLLTLLGVSRRK